MSSPIAEIQLLFYIFQIPGFYLIAFGRVIIAGFSLSLSFIVTEDRITLAKVTEERQTATWLNGGPLYNLVLRLLLVDA